MKNFFAICCLVSGTLTVHAAETDPFLWLEEVEGKKALEWVTARNQETLAVLENDPRYAAIKQEAENILQATDRIPGIRKRGRWLYNFWQDKDHVRGIWRRTTIEEYRKKNPSWEVVLDIDELGRREKKSWVFKGVSFLPPSYTKCLVNLSPGGKDASEWREFDVEKKKFVPDGFQLKEAKSEVAWIDEDTLLVGTDFGPGSLTDSGYPRIVKRWRRGTPLEKAVTVFECDAKDVSADPWVLHRPEGKTVLVTSSPSFFALRVWLLQDAGKRLRIPLPEEIRLYGVFKNRLLVKLNRNWKGFAMGDLIALDLADVRARKTEAKTVLVYRPDERSAVPKYGGLADLKDSLVLTVMTDVKTRLLSVKFGPDGKVSTEEYPAPKTGTVGIHSASPFGNDLFYTYEDFLTPKTLYYLAEGRKKPEPLKAIPQRFDAAEFETRQSFATAEDGTRIPYFLIAAKGMKRDGNHPTLLYGYGGFVISRKPTYLTTQGKLWLERGGVFVMANIRGGGEYGPKWHQAALKKNRQVAFGDFIAIAEDLVRTKVTSPRRLGIMGGSNGGLLVGAVMVQRPELLNAVICQVPLLDMLRYHKLLAGASWMGEYGNPDDLKMREVLRKYSPYHNVLSAKERRYPEALFLTSTKDDRVHPGHARKMVARLMKQDHKVFYYENMEGGHSAAADLLQTAKRKALETVYLLQKLKD